MQKTITIGTRGSQLALYQAKKVQELLSMAYPDLEIKLEIIKTKGDKILDVSLSKIGDKGLFTKELEVALLDGTIDLAVHSLKDMPTSLPDELKISAVLERGETCDALVSKNHIALKDLGSEHKIATSSLRRKAALLNYNPNFTIVDIRGNVNTRLQRMADGHCDAMIMAATGLQRLGLDEYITEILPKETIIPAVSQGVIAIEIASNNTKIDTLLQAINHAITWQTVSAERVFMHTLQGGCQVPVGCYSTLRGQTLTLKGFVATVNGKRFLTHEVSGDITNANMLGKELADALLRKGGKEILNQIRPE